MKILEYKNQDWLKGQSAHPSIPVGGLFQIFSGCNPFESGGTALPSLTPDNKTLATTPKTLVSFNNGGTKYIYAHTNTKLYQVLQDSPYTVTDVTAQIYQHSGTPGTHLGAIVYKGKYVYGHIASGGGTLGVYANTFPVASGNDTTIVSSLQSANMDVMRFCPGADGNLWFTQGGIALGEITSVTGTTGNGSLFYIDDGFFIRDLINDGTRLVIFADNNVETTTSRVTGSYKCKIYFWDMVQTDANSRIVPDAMWEYSDSYVIGGKATDKGIEFFGYNGLYVTNVATEPKMIRPFPSTLSLMGRPTNPYQIAFSNGSLYWVDGFSSSRTDVYAYGNPTYGEPKIFYRPYSNGNVVTNTCISLIANEVVVGSDAPDLSFHNVSATRGTLQITSLDTVMPAPHKYDATKVVLKQPLASGQSVQVVVTSQNGANIVSSETKSYSAAKPKQTLLFRRAPSSTNQVEMFEDLAVSVSSTGAAIQRISTYATPQEDLTELL